MSCGKSCNCPSYRDHLKSISFSATTMPNRKSSQEPLGVDQREKQLERDLPAYKRLRQDGIQPKHIRGAADWESKGSDKFEIETNRDWGKDLGVVKEVAVALAENDA